MPSCLPVCLPAAQPSTSIEPATTALIGRATTALTSRGATARAMDSERGAPLLSGQIQGSQPLRTMPMPVHMRDSEGPGALRMSLHNLYMLR